MQAFDDRDSFAYFSLDYVARVCSTWGLLQRLVAKKKRPLGVRSPLFLILSLLGSSLVSSYHPSPLFARRPFFFFFLSKFFSLLHSLFSPHLSPSLLVLSLFFFSPKCFHFFPSQKDSGRHVSQTNVNATQFSVRSSVAHGRTSVQGQAPLGQRERVPF